MIRVSGWNAISSLAIILGLVLVPQLSHATPTLVVNGSGILTGVQDVVVGSTTYNVTFAEGTCVALYSNCSSFTFSDSTAASAASALLGAIESPTDFDETKIFGCGNANDCEIFTPTSVDGLLFVHGGRVIDWTAAGTAAFGLPDIADFGQGNGNGADSSTSDAFVYALWSPTTVSTAGVPEPGSLALLASALLGLCFFYRRKQSLNG